jgi:hypothetical protein
MIDDLHHNMNLVIPGLNFWGDQNDAAKSVVDKTKWVMQTAIDRIEKLEAALRALKALHDEGGIGDLQERDDRTYFMVCDALEGNDD